MNIPSLRCYYHIYYEKKTGKASTYIAGLDENDNLLFSDFKTFSAVNFLRADLKALDWLVKELEELEIKRKLSINANVMIYAQGRNIIREIKLSYGSKSNVFSKISLNFQWHKNWQLVFNNSEKSCLISKVIDIKAKRRQKKQVSGEKKPQDIEKKLVKLEQLIQNENTKLVFLDLEMNCSNGKKNMCYEIISIGAVKCSVGESFEVENLFYSIVKPTMNPILSERCTNLTGIEQYVVDRAENFNSVFKRFEEWVGENEQIIFVAWGGEDVKTILRDQILNRTDLNIIKVIKESNHNFQREFSQYMGTRNSYSLTNALGFYNKDFEGKKHNALWDAFNLYRLYVEYRNAVKERALVVCF